MCIRDSVYSVEEETTGSVGGNLGYSDFGLMLGFNLQEQNFLGSGNTVGIGINKNIYSESYNISFVDPYATEDGVSLGYNIYFRETDYGEFNVANYLTNSNGLGAQFGYPISDITRLGFSLTYDKTDIDIGTLPARKWRTPFTSCYFNLGNFNYEKWWRRYLSAFCSHGFKANMGRDLKKSS